MNLGRLAGGGRRQAEVGTWPGAKVVLARNGRLADECNPLAFAALTASPGARAFYDQHRAAGDALTTEPSEPSPTDSSAFPTAAYDTAPPTTNTRPGATASKKRLDALRAWDV